MIDLDRIANKRGVKVIDRGNGHFQLSGALLVNYYPNSKSKTAYVDGTIKSSKNVTPKQAVEMCFKQPVLQGKKDKRKGSSRLKRKRLIAKGNNKCHWCKEPITLENSTLEHIIPLGIGGLDNANNWSLACKKCNENRGSDMPELTSK